MTFQTITRTAFLLGATTALSGCFLQPGSFDSTLTVLEDGRFTYAYEGEIVMAGLGDLAEMADAAEGEEPCVDEDSGEERACTQAELDERAAKKAQEMAMMQAMMGQADMSDPQQMAEFASMLERQAGWNSVEVAEEGVFNVSFSITSQLGHDFDFPTIEGMPMGSSFVQLRLRDEGRVKVDAPGFSGTGAGGPMSGMMGEMFGAMAAGQAADESADDPALARPIEGTFRIVTNARILTNNTDEGPQDSPGGMQTLTWNVAPGASTTPAALLAINPR